MEGESSGERCINDSNQYSAFDVDKEFLQPGMSFPVSEHSEEAHTFENDFKRILACLRTNNIDWQSVECVGRVTESKSIKTTVLIGLSQTPDAAEKLRLEGLLQPKMGCPKLRLEFVEGCFEEESPFGFKEQKRPLVCGISCGKLGGSSTGTIGGYITIKGDPDRDAVYAITCHHVLSKESTAIPWLTTKDPDMLPISESVRRDLTVLDNEESWTNMDLDKFNKVLILLSSLDPPFK